MDSEFKRENIKINIEVQDKDFYIITSENKEGKFEVERRFKDLLMLRKTLTRQWPGCYVPYIPKTIVIPKQSNLSEAEMRKLVESYLIKIISIHFLYKSEIFQTFMKEQRDFTKIPFEQESIIEISERYRKVFSHVSLNELEVSYIDDSVQYFSNILSKLEKIYEVSLRNTSNYQDFAISLSSTLTSLNKVGSLITSKEPCIQLRDECINPYGIIKDWVLGEIFDVKGILFTMKSRKKVSQVVKKLSDAHKNQEAALEKISNGRVGLLNKLAGKNEEAVKETATNALMEIRHELEMARITEKIIDCRLSKIELPYFRKTKKQQFVTIFKAFIKANVDEFESLMEQSRNTIFTNTSNNKA